MGSLQPGPKLDEPVPDFTLKTGDGKSEFTLSRQIGPRPIVLVFGNFTCGQFRHQGENIETLHHRYGDRANFVMVYVREVHLIDGWKFDHSDPSDLTIAQPKTYDDRAGVCRFARGPSVSAFRCSSTRSTIPWAIATAPCPPDFT